MLKLEKGFCDIAFHGELEGALGVVPFEIDSDVAVAFPVGLHGVVIADVFFQGVGHLLCSRICLHSH